MMLLELVHRQPDWYAALEVTLTRPPGVHERRAGEDPWAPPRVKRPRRLSDDLLWLRHAYDRPQENGLTPIDDTAAVAVWKTQEDELLERLERLSDRGVLEAAGFLLHDPDAALNAFES
jgi:hypothetical protein